jgi:hypothetical protein
MLQFLSYQSVRTDDPLDISAYILRASIEHQESKAAFVFLTVQKEITSTFLHVHEGDELIFKGVQVGTPTVNIEGSYDIYFLSSDDDIGQKLQEFVKALHTDELSPLLMASCGDNLTGHDHVLKIPYMDPVTHEIVPMDVLSYEPPVDISKYCLEDIKSSIVAEPISGVNVCVNFHFTQDARGCFNMYPKIASLFDGGYVNVYDGQRFAASYPRMGQPLTKSKAFASHYVVLSGHLRDVVVGEIATKSRRIKTKTDSVAFKRTTFTGDLTIGWHYQIQRVETVQYKIGQEVGPTKQLLFNVDLGVRSTGYVMDDDDVQLILKQIYEIARNYYVMGRRIIKKQVICVRGVKLKLGMMIKCGDHIGMITKIRRDVRFGQDVTHIELMDFATSNDAYDLKGILTEIPRFVFEKQDDPYMDLSSKPLEFFVEKLELFNSPEFHERQFYAWEDNITLTEAKAFLRSYPTTIRMAFKDMRDVIKIKKEYHICF